MSLCKQIQIWISIILLVMLIFALKTNLDCTRKFAANQLSISARNIADLMALSLSSQLSDQTQLEANIDRVFADGQFRKITLYRLDGSVIYQRQAEKIYSGIPIFFEKYVSINFSKIEAQIYDQEIRFGAIEMELDPGLFYLALWTNFKKISLVFFCFGIVAVISSYFILKVLLNTLDQIQNQAEAISHNKYIINKKISKTPELKKVSTAMNTMVEKVQSVFNRHLEDIKYFQDLQFFDPVTGLHNRNFMVKRLNHFLDSDTEKTHGYFFLLGLVGMEQNNISTGHPVIQEFYKGLADIFLNAIRQTENAVTARLSKQEFGIILPDCAFKKAMKIAQNTINAILELIAGQSALSDLVKVSAGLAFYNYKDDAGSVLAKTDYALSIAKNNPSGSIEVFEEKNDQTIMGKYQWQTMLHTALSQRRFFLTSQPVISEKGELHQEVYVNLTDQSGKVRKAGYFIPMATSLGLVSRIDKYVLEHAAEYLKKDSKKILAVNISIAFCKERLAVVWLRNFLEANQFIKRQLYFEIHDINIIQYPDICFDLVRMLKQMGFGFGIDQCTLNDTSLNLLKEFKPDYLKIEKDYFLDIENRGNTEVALNALLTLTDSLNIKLIVTKIEDKAFQEALVLKKIKYFQGFGIAEIQPLQ